MSRIGPRSHERDATRAAARDRGIAATSLPPSRLQLPRGPWTTVLDALCAHFPQVDEASWRDRFARGRVLDADGVALDVSAAYRAGLEVRYFREVVDEPVIPFTETVLHVDAHLVVAWKPHFLPVAPTGAYVRETLLTRLVERLDNPALAPLHRIDRDTAGLVLFSADPSSRAPYHALFRERRIRKRYMALAPPLPGLVFPHTHESRLEPGEPFYRMREVPGAPNSETMIDVIARGEHAWTYRLEPVTGRKHQLRVHMAALGAPILHDRLYPQLQAQAPDNPQRALRLCAHALAFEDPLSGEPRRFEVDAGFDAPGGGLAVARPTLGKPLNKSVTVLRPATRSAGQHYRRTSSSPTSNTSEAPGGITLPTPFAP